MKLSAKILSLACVAALAAGLVACGGFLLWAALF